MNEKKRIKETIPFVNHPNDLKNIKKYYMDVKIKSDIEKKQKLNEIFQKMLKKELINYFQEEK